MNNTNPFIPQGSLLEQRNKKRARVKLAVTTIFALNILAVGTVLVIGGCKRDQAATDSTTTTADTTSTTDSNNASAMNGLQATNPLAGSNVAPAIAPIVPVAPTPAPVAVVAPTATEYVVVKGDNFQTIAKKFNVKVKDLEAANSDIVPTKIGVGKKIKIPEGSTSAPANSMTSGSDNDYVVKSGDTLSKIATQYGTTYKALMDLNGLKTTQIKPGAHLKVPTKSATAASPIDTAPPAATTTASNPTSSTPKL